MYLNLSLHKGENLIIKEEYLPYEKKEQIITFLHDEIKNIIDLKQKIFIRENEEYRFTINFENNTCTYELKKEQTCFDILVDYANLNQSENIINLEYMIETDDEKNNILITLK